MDLQNWINMHFKLNIFPTSLNVDENDDNLLLSFAVFSDSFYLYYLFFLYFSNAGIIFTPNFSKILFTNNITCNLVHLIFSLLCFRERVHILAIGYSLKCFFYNSLNPIILYFKIIIWNTDAVSSVNMSLFIALFAM